MNEMKVTASHLRRTAVIYVRQSTLVPALPRSGRPATVVRRGPARRHPPGPRARLTRLDGSAPQSCADLPKWLLVTCSYVIITLGHS
jgi:hypothetical protein